MEAYVRIISVRPFVDGWIFEYQDIEFLNHCDYISMLLDTPYILMDKHTQEIFFVYLKPDGLETFLDDRTIIEKGIIIPYIPSKNIEN